MMDVLVCILLIVLGVIFGLIVAWSPNDGTMYFYVDEDGKEYTFAEFKYDDIHLVDKQKSITLKCVKLPPDFSLSQEKQGL